MKFVVVGQQGIIVVSGNDKTWNKVASDTLQAFTIVLFAKDRFIAVGTAGTVAYSYNGISWKLSTHSQTNKDLHDIIYANPQGEEQFITIGDNSTILSSSNGKA